MARSGDLEIEVAPGQTRKVRETEVLASHQRRRRYSQCPPLKQVLATASPADQTRADGAGPHELILDDKEGREFILAQLALGTGETSQSLALKCATYLKKTRGQAVDVARCQARLEELAQKMVQEGLVKCSFGEGGLFLSLG